VPNTITTARAVKTIAEAYALNWTANPVSSAPTPSPPAGATLPMIVPSRLCRRGLFDDGGGERAGGRSGREALDDAGGDHPA
jgi:hypothetical protein